MPGFKAGRAEKQFFKTIVMAKVCDLTGKKPITGNHVSHSNRKTKRRFYPNLQTKKFFMPETGEWVTLKVSASALRTINKLGLYTYIKQLEKKGEIIYHGEDAAN